MSKINEQSLEYYLNLDYPVKIYREDGGFFAKIEDLPGCITEGETLEEVYKNINEAKILWIETAYEDEFEIPLPQSTQEYSGKFIVRVPRTVHKRLAEQAKKEGISLNQYLVSILSQESGLASLHKDIEHIKGEIGYLASCSKGSQDYSSINVPYTHIPMFDELKREPNKLLVGLIESGENGYVRSA